MTNQYTSDSDVLFVSQGSPVTELRKAFDQVILYTEDNELYQKFKQWKQLLFFQPYYREVKGHDKLIAVDLYFPKSALKQLMRALTNNRLVPSKKGGSIS